MISSPRMASSVHAPEFLAGVHTALHERGLCLLCELMGEVAPDGSGSDRAPRIVRENAVDGLLVNYAFGTPAAIRDLLDRCGLPAVWINRKRDANCVRPADEGAAREATRFVLGHGHRRVMYLAPGGFVAGSAAAESDEAHYSEADRRLGYASEMIDAGLKPLVRVLPPERIGRYAPGCGVDACARVLGEPDRPTAVVCGGDLGRSLVAAAWRLGLRVPEDLSVITFDNQAHADHTVAVDRMLVPHAAMGRAAITELLALIEEPTVARSPVVLPFGFHQTGTVSGPPPAVPL